MTNPHHTHLFALQLIINMLKINENSQQNKHKRLSAIVLSSSPLIIGNVGIICKFVAELSVWSLCMLCFT